MSTIVSMVRQLQNAMRGDPGLDGDAQRIAQLSWMLYLRAIEREWERETASFLKPNLRWTALRAAASTQAGDSLLVHVNQVLVPGLRGLTSDSDIDLSKVTARVFSEVRNHMASAALFREVVARVDALFEEAFKRTHRHAIGEIYETVLADLQSAGNAGEFYTPRALTNAVAELLSVRPGDSAMDPALGTGGFLISAFNVANSQGAKVTPNGHPSLIGFEKKHLPFVLCATNLLLHGALHDASILRENFLGEGGELSEVADVVLSNPPFGGLEEPGIENAFPRQFRSRETADLFLLRIMQALKSGGRAGVVLPDRFLFASGATARIREVLCETFNLHTIVRLPEGVFAPYTGIKTNILFFEKRPPRGNVWFYEVQLPEGKRSFSKSQPMTRDDLLPLFDWWHNRHESASSEQVTLAQLKERGYNLDIRIKRHIEIRPSIREGVKTFARETRDHHRLRDELQVELANHLREGKQFFERALTSTFEALTSHTGGIVVLKKSILRLGTAGRLTSPVPGSEVISSRVGTPNSLFGDLPEETGAWKGWFEESFATSVPAGWQWTTMSGIGEIVSGGTPGTHDAANFADQGIPWITPADLNGLQSKTISRGRRDLSPKGLASCSARLLPEGTVLFSSRAPIGYVAIAGQPLATNQGFKSVVLGHGVMPEYLYYYLLAWSDLIEQKASGTTFKEVPGRLMSRIPFLLPPLADQRQLVGTLDRFSELIDALGVRLSRISSAQEELSSRLGSTEAIFAGGEPKHANKA